MPVLMASPPPPSPSAASKTSRKSPISQPTSTLSSSRSTLRSSSALERMATSQQITLVPPAPSLAYSSTASPSTTTGRPSRKSRRTWSLFLRCQAQAERQYRRAVDGIRPAQTVPTRVAKRTHLGGPTQRAQSSYAPPDEPISEPSRVGSAERYLRTSAFFRRDLASGAPHCL